MGSHDKPTTRRYTVEQKNQAVRLVRRIRAETGQAHGAVQRVAAQVGYGVESVRSWVKQADIDGGVTSGVTTAEAERVKKLEQENRELRRANEILNAAQSQFLSEESPEWSQRGNVSPRPELVAPAVELGS